MAGTAASKRRVALLGVLLAPLVAVSLAFTGMSAPVASAAAPTVARADSWLLTSPGASVGLTVRMDSGHLSLAATRDGADVVAATDLGLLTSAGDLSSTLSVTSVRRRAVHDQYTMTTGKKLRRTVNQNELVLGTRTSAGRAMDLVLRAADDGIAFRYVVHGSGDYTVTREPVTFSVPSAPAWLQSYNAAYENTFTSTTSTTAATGDYGFPALFGAPAGYTMLTESDVTGTYAGSHLTHTAGTSSYGLALYDKTPVKASGTLTTPWRVAVLGSPDRLIGSTLVDDLSRPDALRGDTSWIKPGMSAWSWIGEGASEQAQGNLATQERYVDLAAKEGWPYMLVDAGWNPDWMPTLVRYAAARGVAINAWFAYTDLYSDAQMTSWFTRLRAWGVTGVKVDYMNSDSQTTFDFYDRILRATAKYHLMIDFHGATLPKGIARTWPQIMSYEGVRGEENGRDSVLNTILPFTRNVVGSMDYTPTVFTHNSQTSKGQELAETVVFESGWQHPADTPQAYAAEPAAATFLANVPTTWDDTHYVTGTPGSSAVLARRSGGNWFMGGVTSGPASTLTVPLTALGSGRWLIDLVTDHDGSLQHQTLTRTAAGVLRIPVAAHGGFALEACKADGRSTCYRPVVGVPSTATLVDTDVTDVDTGDVVSVRGTFVVRSGGPARNVRMDVDLPQTWKRVSGAVVTKSRLTDGHSITGVWRVRVGKGGPRGAVDLPVTATYVAPSGRTIHAADAATLQVALIPPTGDAQLSAQPFVSSSTDYGSVQRDTDLRGDPIKLGNEPTTYATGVVANANASISVYLGGRCSSLTAKVGVTPDGDDPSEGSVTFQAFDQGGTALAPPVGTSADPVTIADGAVPFSVPTTGVQVLTLKIGDAGDGINNDHGAFADAVLHCAS